MSKSIRPSEIQNANCHTGHPVCVSYKYLFSTICFHFNYSQIKGVCTPQGSCRVLGKDYVFQGGCGEASQWEAWKFLIVSTFYCCFYQGGELCVYQRIFHALWSCSKMRKSQDIALWVVTVGQGLDTCYGKVLHMSLL